MTFSNKCSGHYSRSNFHNNANYKKTSYILQQRTQKPTKKDLRHQLRVQSRSAELKKSFNNRVKKIQTKRQKKIKSIYKLFTPEQDNPRLSLISLDHQITPESNLFLFGSDKGDNNPYTLWVISNKVPHLDIPKAISNYPLDTVLKSCFSVNIKLYPELSETLKGFTDDVTDIFYKECKVKDDPVLVKVLHAFGTFQMCAKDLVSNDRPSGCYLVEQLN